MLFLGDSITYEGLYSAYFEAYTRLHCDWHSLNILNAALPSETVSGLSEANHANGAFPRPNLHDRLARVLEITLPDFVVACYGMNDGIYLPHDSARFSAFTSGMEAFHRFVDEYGVQIVHLTPPPFEDVNGSHPGYDDVITREAEWLLRKRDAGWLVLDLLSPLQQYALIQKSLNSSFRLAEDGIHPGPLGHWWIAQCLLLAFGIESAAKIADIGTLENSHPYGREIVQFIVKRQNVIRDAYLSAVGHQRPGLPPGISVSDAEKIADDMGKHIEVLQGSEQA